MRTLVFCAAIVFGFVAAATAASTNSSWFARTWETEDGLPNNSVNSLAQTSDGFLWVATSAGLARFDGAMFDDISLTNFIGQPYRGITALLQNRSGGLWLEMDRGVIADLNASKVSVIVPTNGLLDLPARTLVEGDDGALWISYVGGAICYLKNGQATVVTPELGLPWAGVSSVAKDTKGRIWLSRDGKVGIFQNGQFHSLVQPGSRSICLTSARRGGIWICSGAELFYFDEGATLEKIGELTVGDIRAEPSAILEDSHGAIWVGTAYSGLFRFDGLSRQSDATAGAHFEKIPTSHPEISSLLEDDEGNIWVGTHGGGLNRLRPRALTLENVQKDLPFAAVQSVCEDKNGTLWAVTENGLLARRDADGWEISTNIDWRYNSATCVAADSTGAIWIGTRNHRLIRLQDGQAKMWGRTRKLTVSPISALLVSSNGDLWIGGFNQTLQVLHNDTLTDVTLPNDVRTVRAIAQDAAGEIWIGTSGGLLLRIDNGKVIDETEKISGEEKSIRCLYTSPDGGLWIGFAGYGLGRLKDGHFSQISSAQGLFDDYISQIVPDGHGWFWLGADRGIFKVREQELIDATENPNADVRSIHFGRGEGLPSLQADYGFTPGAIRSRDGQIWIPTRSALAVINPQNSDNDSKPPTIFIKRLIVDGKILAAYDGLLPLPNTMTLRKSSVLQLPPEHHKLEFDFTALNFTAPENVRLQYRLDGLDNDWIDASPERNAVYSRLSAGNYRFRVRASNSDGVWNETGATFAFTVTPFIWQQWWFQSLALILFAAIMIVAVRYISFRRLRSRLRALEQQAALDKERARIARDLHDDLGSHLTKIVLLSDLMVDYRSAPDKSSETAQRVSTTARQVIKTLDETVWAVNPRNDTLPHLLDYIGQFAVEFLRTAEIRCHVDMPLRVPEKNVSTDVRHNLFLVVKETLNNVVKHANASEVWLRVTIGENFLNVVIEDNGCGFANVPDNSCADGLRNMRQRIEEIGGEFELESKPSAGTRIAIITPLKK